MKFLIYVVTALAAGSLAVVHAADLPQSTMGQNTTPVVVQNPRQTAHLPDSEIVKNIEEKLAQDDVLKHFNFVIVSHDAVVSINGTVDNQAQADAVVKTAKNTSGVKNVKSNIIIKAPPINP